MSSLVAILRIMDVQHYRDYISSFVDREPLLVKLELIIDVSVPEIECCITGVSN